MQLFIERGTNDAYLSELCWSILTQGSQLWVQVIRHKYGTTEDNILASDWRGNGSWMWNSLSISTESYLLGFWMAIRWWVEHHDFGMIVSFQCMVYSVEDCIASPSFESLNLNIRSSVSASWVWLWERFAHAASLKIAVVQPLILQDPPDLFHMEILHDYVSSLSTSSWCLAINLVIEWVPTDPRLRLACPSWPSLNK